MQKKGSRAPAGARLLPDFAPVPRKPRFDGWTPERQRQFIEALAETGSVKHAAMAVNMSPVGAYYLRRQPGAEEFAAAWLAALDCGVERLEDIAMERALNGVEVPVYSYGKLIGSRIVYNDRLLMFILRNRATARFAASGMRIGAKARQEIVDEARAEWDAEREQNKEAMRASILRKIEAIEAHERKMGMEVQKFVNMEAFEAFERWCAERGLEPG